MLGLSPSFFHCGGQRYYDNIMNLVSQAKTKEIIRSDSSDRQLVAPPTVGEIKFREIVGQRVSLLLARV